MAASKIPEEIKKHRPGPCTEVKLINGHYYVYMYQSVQLPSGKWGKKTADQYKLERRGPQRAVTYTVPKKSIGIRPPYGESRRQRDIENARKNGLPFMKPMQEEQDAEG